MGVAGRCGFVLGLILSGLALIGLGQGFVGPSQMDLCDQATFTVTVTNASATQEACHIVLRNVVPNDGFTLVPGTSTLTLVDVGESFVVDPADGAWDIDAVRGTEYVLGPGGEMTLVFDLATNCRAVSGNDTLTVDFEDCAVPGVPLRNTHSTSIEILPGAIVISKTPSVVEASVGDVVTWTVTAENTGLGSVTHVVVTDVLGAGLEFVSASDGGGLSGGAIVWSAATTPALEEIAAGESVPLSITARVVACEDLSDAADVRWGCNSGEVCEDSSIGSCGCHTATASIALVVELPDLAFSAPAITIPYCTQDETVTIPIVNEGLGPARNVRLCAALGGLTVRSVEGTATYADGCFTIPLIPGSSTYNLQFHVAFAGDWCTGGPSGSPIYTLTYENDCGIEHRARPQIGSVGASGGPSLSATKSGPSLGHLGEELTYQIAVTYSGPTSCGTGATGQVSVVDDVPEGYVVVDAGGGTVLPSGDIVWTFDPTVDPSFSTSVTIRVPNDCGACYTETANELSASVVDCCGCTRTASAAAPIAIECRLLFSSQMTVTPETLVRCGDPATFTDTQVFAADASLDPVSFDEYQYATLPSNGLAYVPGSLAVTVDGGPASATVDDATPDGPLGIRIDRTDSVRGHTVVYTYQLQATEDSLPACGGTSTFYVWTSHQLGVDAPGGVCGTLYDATPVSIEPPAMSVSVSGIPSIQDECATYDVTLTLSRTSTNAVPYDARLVLSGLAPYAADASLAACGGVAPGDGTACTAPIETADSMEWRFADAFALGDTAMITLPVTVPCGGPLLALAADAFYDDLCSNDDVYDNVCSASAGGAASLSVAADVCVQKTPEIIFATEKEVTWRVCVVNVGNGVAANTWVEDTLGAGLVYVSSSISDGMGATERPNEDRLGAPTNGVTWLIDELQPGEERAIELTARLVACSGMTNDVAVGWGCLGQECQAPKTDSSSVVVPTSSMVATSYLPTPVDVCASETVTVTAKNAGVTATYDIVAEVTLPDGVSYAGGAEYRVGSGSWISAPDPSGTPGPTLTWTASEIPALAVVAAREPVQIRFVVATDCAFGGGVLGFQVGYKNPCGNEFASGVGAFSVSARVPDVAVDVRQVNPPAGDAIACDGEATWEIDVTNAGTIVVPVVRVGALLDDGLVFVDSSGDPTYGPADGGSQAGSSVAWELASLPVGATATLSLTAAAPGGGASCEALGLFVDAYWGCGLVDGASSTADAGCITSSPTTATIEGTRVPPVDATAAVVSPGFEVCGSEGTIQVTVENTSTTVTASDIAIALSLPTGLTYVGETTAVWPGGGSTADPTETPGPDLSWPLAATLGPGETLALTFVAESSCYTATRTIDVDVTYLDCCGTTPSTVSASAAAPALVPSLALSKTPATSALDCLSGEEVTWTLRVTNEGTGTADIVRVVDTLGDDLVHVSGGTEVAGDPQVWGWEFGPLGPGEFEDVTLTGELSSELGGCDAARRTNTATALWACGTPDGNPTTTGEYECSGGTVEDTAVVQVANLAVGSADIVPAFACTGDGAGSGALAITIRNPSDAPVTQDFAVEAIESTTGWSVSGTFTSLGGTLPLAANGSQTLTLPGWPVTCSACIYRFAVTVDAAGQICECAEGNNTATLDYTLTVPDLSIDSAGLAVACSADGQIRIQGPLVVRNAGCGSAYTGSIPLRVTLYDAAGCVGAVLDQFTLSLTGASVPAGGTQSFTLDRTRTLNVCGTCAVSIRLELDYANAICECDGTNNALCLGPYAIAFPDLRIGSVDVSGITCAGDTVSGAVGVIVENIGCGVAGAFNVALASDGCLTFANQRVAGLAAGASTVVTFPVAIGWSDCTDCSCTLTATVDSSSEVCECTAANNQGASALALTRPDLEISSANLALSCVGDGVARLSGSVQLANTGCASVTETVELRVTVYEGTGCLGDAVASWIDTLSSVSLTAAGGTQGFPIDDLISDDLCFYGTCEFSARLDVDPNDIICECDGTDNALCVSVLSSIADLRVALATPTVATSCSPGNVLVAVQNAGCGTVGAGVVVRISGDAVGEAVTTGALSAGGSEFVSVALDRALACGEHTVTVSVDPDGVVCECDDDNNAAMVAFTVDDPDAAPSNLVVVCRGDGTFGVSVDLDNRGTQDATDIDAALYVDEVLQSSVVRTVAAGESAALSFDTAALKCGIDHMFRVVADPGDAFCECDETNNAVAVTVTCPCPALVTTKTIASIRRGETFLDVAGPVEPGDTVGYELTVQNVGGATAFGVNAEDVLPLPFSYIPGTSSATWPSGASTADPVGGTGPNLSFPLSATLEAGETLTLTLDATVGSDVSPGIDYVNAMTAVGTEGEGSAIPADTRATIPADIDDDDASAISIQAAEPALVTAKSVEAILRDGLAIPASSSVGPGDRVRYRVTVSNVGGGVAYQVNVADTLPSGFSYLAGTTAAIWPAGTSAGDPTGGIGPTLEFPVNATLPAGGSLTVIFDVLVTAEVDEVGPYKNVALAAGTDGAGTVIVPDNSGDVAADTDDDDESDTTLLPAPPALVTTKVVAAIVRGEEAISPTSPIDAGDVVTYRMTVENVGRGTAHDVSVEDALPLAFTYVDGSTSISWPSGTSSADPAGRPGPTLSWSPAATLEFGDILSLEFDARLGSLLEGSIYVNRMTAFSHDADGEPTPADRSEDVPEDVDEDDSSAVSLPAIMPGLVVDKTITDVRRDGVSLGPISVAVPGDVVEYRFTIRNVGSGTAYSVDFVDQLPPGLEYEAGAPYGGGTYSVSAPAASGSLSVPDGGTSFATSISASIGGGGRLVATYYARITESAATGVPLQNSAEAEGLNGAGIEIPDTNPLVGDTADDDVEDPDADDTGVAAIRVGMPALAVDKETVDVERHGTSIGAAGPVEPGDVIVYLFAIRNVGTDTAYGVGFVDTLPPGVEVEESLGTGTYVVDLPAAGPLPLGWSHGATGDVTASLGARIAAGGTLIATYRVRVTSDVVQGERLVNTARAFGVDVVGAPIPPVNPLVGDTFDDDPDDADADDTGLEAISVAEPALVTEKTVAEIVRDGTSLGFEGPVKPGDLVTYRLRVSNVGLGIAYGIGITDTLPSGVTYEGPSLATWPGGGSTASPSGGSTLMWNLNATLDSGEEIVLLFEARVTAAAATNAELVNVLRAAGVDGAGKPISADNGADVPLDDDVDDEDSVRLLVDFARVPALVTEKSVARILRDGVTTFGVIVEPEDLVTFELNVRNVGDGTAYRVDVSDRLPNGLAYVLGSSVARWPSGVSIADPLGSEGPDLEWTLRATLGPGEAIRLTFNVLAADDLIDGQMLVNRMEARGEDADAEPIPGDRSGDVPADVDSDDASDLMLTTRSSLVQGEGGTLEAPILRKDVERLSGEVCRRVEPTPYPVWFQTDIAFYAAAELEWLATRSSDGVTSRDTLLPTWLRTLSFEADGVGFQNVVEVTGASGMGVPLVFGPRFRDTADPAAEVARRLDALASSVGLAPAERPADERWIVLEYAGGDPRFAARSEEGTLWPTGEWMAYDRRIVPSAVGMSLLKQAMEARRRLGSAAAIDRYVGCVLVEVMRGKVACLRDLHAATEPTDGLLGHAYAAKLDASSPVYSVVDPQVKLFDQLALAWGLAAYVELAADEGVWPNVLGTPEPERTAARQEVDVILDGVARQLRTFDGSFRESTADADGTPARTTTLGLLLAALEDVSRVVGPHPTIQRLAAHAALELTGRIEEEDRVGTADGGSTLADRSAAIRGLAAAASLLGVSTYADEVVRLTASLERDFWDPSLGAFVAQPLLDGGDLCTTPFELGLVVGALREAAGVAAGSDAERWYARIARHGRTIVDSAALHLAKALPADGLAAFAGDGDGFVAPTRIGEAPLGWAYVLQQRLCLPSRAEADDPCIGLAVDEHDVDYQTDWAMYAGFEIEAAAPWAEDYADANLIAAIVHAGLGTPLASTLWASEAVALGVDPSTVHPVSTPYAGGNPRLVGVADLSWDAGAFDTRRTGSALGMTLLREAQEVGQLLSSASERDRWVAELLLSSALETLDALERIVEAASEVFGVAYVPHAVIAERQDRTWRIDVTESSSRLFDQISLLFGLSELQALVRRFESPSPIEALGTTGDAVERSILVIADAVLEMLSIHLDPRTAELVDEVRRMPRAWVVGDRIDETSLALAVPALTRFLASPLAALRPEAAGWARGLVPMLLDRLAGFDRSTTGCEGDELTPRLAALRAFVAGYETFDARRWRDEACAAFVRLEELLWDETAGMYRASSKSLTSCYTALDLGLLVGSLGRLVPLLDSSLSARAAAHLETTFARWTDAARMQLSSRSRLGEAEAADEYAPVFDRRICVRRVEAGAVLGDEAEAGDLLRYRISVDNPTEQTWTDLVLTDVLPPGTVIESASPTPEWDGETLRWPFASLSPGEEKTWTVLARLPDDAASGNVYENCATLTYHDVGGVEGTKRRACVETRVDAPTTSAKKSAWWVDLPTYDTSEAMYLSAILMQLSAADWGRASDGVDYALGNLGTLLADSRLGLLLSEGGGGDLRILRDRLARLVDRSCGAERVLEDLVLIPFRGGQPVLVEGQGFRAQDPTVTAAALGQTLAMEAAALRWYDAWADDWAAAMGALLREVAAAQVSWIEAHRVRVDPSGSYVPRAIARDTEGRWSPVEEETDLYGQASLLWGCALLVRELDQGSEAQGRAERLIEATLDRIAEHADPTTGTYVREMPAGDPAGAPWRDLELAARAFEAVARSTSRRSGEASERLHALISAAEETLLPADPVEAAAYLRVLLYASTTSGQAEEAWRALRSRSWMPLHAVLGDPSSGASVTFTPREAAVLFDLLATLGERGLTSLGVLDRSFDSVMDRARLQLVAPPSGYWRRTLSPAPAYVAPVFGRRVSQFGPPRRAAYSADGTEGDLMLFTIDLTTPTRLGPIRALLADCAEGLSYVPGSARAENGAGEWIWLDVPRFGPLQFELSRLLRVSRIEYLMWRTGDAWRNEIGGEGLDASGRIVPWGP